VGGALRRKKKTPSYIGCLTLLKKIGKRGLTKHNTLKPWRVLRRKVKKTRGGQRKGVLTKEQGSEGGIKSLRQFIKLKRGSDAE